MTREKTKPITRLLRIIRQRTLLKILRVILDVLIVIALVILYIPIVILTIVIDIRFFSWMGLSISAIIVRALFYFFVLGFCFSCVYALGEYLFGLTSRLVRPYCSECGRKLVGEEQIIKKTTETRLATKEESKGRQGLSVETVTSYSTHTCICGAENPKKSTTTSIICPECKNADVIFTSVTLRSDYPSDSSISYFRCNSCYYHF